MSKRINITLTDGEFRQLILSLKNDYVDNDNVGCKRIASILNKIGVEL